MNMQKVRHTDMAYKLCLYLTHFEQRTHKTVLFIVDIALY